MKKTGLYKKMTLMAIAPTLILGIMVTIICYINFTNIIYDEARTEMRNTARNVVFAYDTLYEGNYDLVKGLNDVYDLYKGEEKITTDYSIVDGFKKNTGADVSLLYKDMRIHTTFATNTGNRFTGICTNSETAVEVLDNGHEAFYENVAMFEGKYLVLYVPLENMDGSIIGMVEVARSSENMKADVLKAVWPTIGLTLLGMLIAVWISYRSTNEITTVLKKLQVFMNKVAGGNLQTEADVEVMKRTDELGDISRSAVSMQKSIRGFVETDPLTGLGNRRFIKGQLSKIRDRAKETGVPFSLAIADIDFFKKVNDTYGHNAGDEVLKAVANTLKFGVQGHGFAGRWGGEEFILCFDKCGMYDGADKLWEILEKIREMVVSTEGYDIKVTMTFGIVDGYYGEIEEMVEAADAKLYYGKQNGRNRVVVDMEKPKEEVIEAPAEAAEIRDINDKKAEPVKEEKPKTAKKPRASKKTKTEEKPSGKEDK